MTTAQKKLISNEDFLTMLIDCERRTQKLSEADNAFITSMRAHVSMGARITFRHKEIIDRLWEKATAKG